MMPNDGSDPAPKADKMTSELRLNDMTSAILDGLQGWKTIEYVRSQEKEAKSPWFVPDGISPLTDGAIRKYLTRAYALLDKSHEKSRAKLRRRHLVQRAHLYARAMKEGELRVALSVLQDEAELHDLYPKPADDLARKIEHLEKQIDAIERAAGIPRPTLVSANGDRKADATG